MDIGPGCVVECVRYRGIGDKTGRPFPGPHLTVGKTYTIEKLSEVGGDGFCLVEIQDKWPSGKRFSYHRKCFAKRPPHREALFRSLLEPTTIREDA